MARTKRSVRNRGRKSQKRKPVRTRRRRIGSAKGGRTKIGTKNMKGGDIRACPECEKKRFHVPAGETLDDNASYLAHRCGDRPGVMRCDNIAESYCELYDYLQKQRYGFG